MNYNDVIYGSYSQSDYSWKLAYYLHRTYFCTLPAVDFLDLGCGDGEYVKQFTKIIARVVGIDSDIDFNKDPLPYEDESFNMVFTKSVIEHIPNTSHFLKEIYRVLRPGGKILILTPAWEYNMKWFYDDPTHVKPFHRKGLQDALRMANFEDVEVNYFYHLPQTWNNPWFKYIATLVRKFTPDSFRWKDKEEQHMNVFIRFSKEVQLLAVATKK